MANQVRPFMPSKQRSKKPIASAESRTSSAARLTDEPGRTRARKATAEAPASPRRRRVYLPASERRRRIISAAQEVFSRMSLQGARTRELAKAAEVNQATLFEHFESKEDLFVAAVVQPLQEVMQGMRDRARAYNDAASVQEMIALGLASSQRHLESMVQIYPLLAMALFSEPTLGRQLYCEHIVPLLKERGKAMRSVVKEGVDSELLALAAFGMYFAIAMDRTFRGKKDELSVITKRLLDIVAFGFVKDGLRESNRQ
jgi:AcrR family transcriptional regulator